MEIITHLLAYFTGAGSLWLTIRALASGGFFNFITKWFFGGRTHLPEVQTSMHVSKETFENLSQKLETHNDDNVLRFGSIEAKIEHNNDRVLDAIQNYRNEVNGSVNQIYKTINENAKEVATYAGKVDLLIELRKEKIG